MLVLRLSIQEKDSINILTLSSVFGFYTNGQPVDHCVTY